jgi:pyruvate carboxylase subunit B
MKLFAHVNGTAFDLTLSEERDAVIAVTPQGRHAVTLDERKEPVRIATIDGRRLEFGWRRDDGTYVILIEGVVYEVQVRDARMEKAAQVRRADAGDTGEAVVKAPIPGRIVKVLVQVGESVAKDQPLLTLDAMKLENEIPAPREGRVRSVSAQAGVAVERGQVLVVIA